jgi:uncharacterized protein (DUF302 family)
MILKNLWWVLPKQMMLFAPIAEAGRFKGNYLLLLAWILLLAPSAVLPVPAEGVEEFATVNQPWAGSPAIKPIVKLIKRMPMQNELSFTVILSESYDEAFQKVTEALKKEGFGVLTEIDVKATLKKKIDVDFRKYSILGACNPPLAHKALQSDPLVGLMLPCNVTVEEIENGTKVNLVNPISMLLANPLLADNEALKEVATDAYQRLERVAKDLSQS